MKSSFSNQEDHNNDDVSVLSENALKIMQNYSEILQLFAEKNSLMNAEQINGSSAEVLQIIFEKAFLDPQDFVNAQFELTSNYLQIINNITSKFLCGQDELASDDVHKNDFQKKDRRFKDEAWEDNIFYNFIKQSYLMNGQWWGDKIDNLYQKHEIDKKTSDKAKFFSKLFFNAICPSNFITTNPEVLRETINSNGENLIKGLENFKKDIQLHDDHFEISTNDQSAFEVGYNIACTKGKVIYQNYLMQLIHYDPKTEKQFQTPILITPPWINKYYILDMQPENSMVSWLLEQGYAVFMISWINPDSSHCETCFEDYMQDGQIQAMHVIRDYLSVPQIHNIGYCIGGTLLSCSAAYLAKQKNSAEKNMIKSLTFLTTLVDFEDAGELSFFINQEDLQSLKKQLDEKGVFEGHNMAAIFNILKSNDMIWSFFVNHYLLGKDHRPFDLLFWNSDHSRLPAKMHQFYLENMYDRNLLKVPNKLKMKNVPIDLRKINQDCYMLSAKEDHIVPWKSSFNGAQNFSGETEYVLTGSGHVAGVVNHPRKNKYGYWVSRSSSNANEWFDGAKFHEGSWWKHFNGWLKKRSGKKIVFQPNIKKYPTIEKAPGSYVKIK